MSTPESVDAILAGGGEAALTRIPEWFTAEQRGLAEAAVEAGHPWWWLPPEVVEREQRREELIEISRLCRDLGYNPRTKCCENVRRKGQTDPAKKFIEAYNATIRELTPLHKSGELMLSTFMRRAAVVVGDHLGEKSNTAIDAITNLLDARGGKNVRDVVAELIRERASGQAIRNVIGLMTYRLRQGAGV